MKAHEFIACPRERYKRISKVRLVETALVI